MDPCDSIADPETPQSTPVFLDSPATSMPPLSRDSSQSLVRRSLTPLGREAERIQKQQDQLVQQSQQIVEMFKERCQSGITGVDEFMAGVTPSVKVWAINLANKMMSVQSEYYREDFMDTVDTHVKQLTKSYREHRMIAQLQGHEDVPYGALVVPPLGPVQAVVTCQGNRLPAPPPLPGPAPPPRVPVHVPRDVRPVADTPRPPWQGTQTPVCRGHPCQPTQPVQTPASSADDTPSELLALVTDDPTRFRIQSKETTDSDNPLPSSQSSGDSEVVQETPVCTTSAAGSGFPITVDSPAEPETPGNNNNDKSLDLTVFASDKSAAATAALLDTSLQPLDDSTLKALENVYTSTTGGDVYSPAEATTTQATTESSSEDDVYNIQKPRALNQ